MAYLRRNGSPVSDTRSKSHVGAYVYPVLWILSYPEAEAGETEQTRLLDIEGGCVQYFLSRAFPSVGVRVRGGGGERSRVEYSIYSLSRDNVSRIRRGAVKDIPDVFRENKEKT